MHEVLVRLEAKVVEEAFSAWAKDFIAEGRLHQIAIDGKTLAGSGTSEYPALHLLAAYCCEISAVISQTSVDSKKNEITVAKEMLFDMPLHGKLITGDAIFCQKELCNIVLKNHGDYIFIVKNNQRQLLADIKEVFKKHSFPLYAQAKNERIRKC
jgi:predicted transposase YbfD/YdcC